MEPTQKPENSLVELLDRLLDKGLVLHADLIITMGDVPLIALNLRAVLAGVQTMLDYGMMPGQIETAGSKIAKNMEVINR